VNRDPFSGNLRKDHRRVRRVGWRSSVLLIEVRSRDAQVGGPIQSTVPLRNTRALFPSSGRLPRWNAPPRSPTLPGRQLELAWNVLVARCAAAAASSPSPRSDRRRRPKAAGTEQRRSLGDLLAVPRFATCCNSLLPRFYRYLKGAPAPAAGIRETSTRIRPIADRRDSARG